MSWSICARRLFWIGFAVLIGGVLLLAEALRYGKAHAAGPALANAGRPVVIELFTSEGCSSCPPADELLGTLSQKQTENGAEVIPLGFHVDYWDQLGWHDRFDSPDYSRRQEDYARKFRIEGPYTPQMVVNGELEFVGSNASRAREAIAQSAAQPAGAEVELAPAPNSSLLVKVKNGRPGDVMLAITEDNLATKVDAGENGGRTLRHSAVVREFRRLGQLKDGSFSGTVPIKVGQDWKPDDLHAVVFVQDGGSGKILGAASIPIRLLPRVN